MSNRKIDIFEDQLKEIAKNFLNSFQEISAAADPPSSSIEEPQPQEQAEQTVVPVEPPPRFRIFWNAWKDGNISKGESESTLETSQMARAETMTKLYDLGFSNIVILAIETIEPPKEEIVPQSI